MTIRKKSDNSRLTKAAFTSLLGAGTTTTVYTVPEDIIENYDTPSSGLASFESQVKLKFRAGRKITQAEIDAAFPTPTVTSVTRDAGGNFATAGGDAFTIKGTNFGGVNGVTIGGTAATSVVVKDSNTIKGVSPAKTAGAQAVVISDDNNPTLSGGNVTYA